eukprot:CAMPEP_0177661966 /NCGR_PEP_ID=MMETSP0447-20121125/19009_1 /TAXON_ID=0 /ORGANISM="Stygamoeba regulata, Strain BSH-02190019" /LENGTH=932 /DNA_ID=CAMNT_0019167441 /DNA_START=131 /DNA_END=2928 /DNA_ORIENTATION=+
MQNSSNSNPPATEPETPSMDSQPADATPAAGDLLLSFQPEDTSTARDSRGPSVEFPTGGHFNRQGPTSTGYQPGDTIFVGGHQYRHTPQYPGGAEYGQIPPGYHPSQPSSSFNAYAPPPPEAYANQYPHQYAYSQHMPHQWGGFQPAFQPAHMDMTKIVTALAEQMERLLDEKLSAFQRQYAIPVPPSFSPQTPPPVETTSAAKIFSDPPTMTGQIRSPFQASTPANLTKPPEKQEGTPEIENELEEEILEKPARSPSVIESATPPIGCTKPTHKLLFEKFTGVTDKFIIWTQKIRQWVMEWGPEHAFLLQRMPTERERSKFLWQDRQICSAIWKTLDGPPFSELFHLNELKMQDPLAPRDLYAFELLDYLRKKYNPKSAARCQAILDELRQLKATANWGSDKYYKFFQEMEDKLQLLRDQEEPVTPAMHIRYLIAALPSTDSWETFKRYRELQPSESVAQLQADIAAEAERQRLRSKRQTGPAQMALHIQGQKPSKSCKYCAKPGHLDTECFTSAKILRDQPDNWKPQCSGCARPSQNTINNLRPKRDNQRSRQAKNKNKDKDTKSPNDKIKQVDFADSKIQGAMINMLMDTDYLALATTDVPGARSDQPLRFMVDSMSNITICNQREFFITMKPCSTAFLVANGTQAHVEAGGPICFQCTDEHGGITQVRIPNAKYVPSAPGNILGCADLPMGCHLDGPIGGTDTINFAGGTYPCQRINGFPMLEVMLPPTTAQAFHANLLHERNHDKCEACQSAKAKTQPFPEKATTRPTTPFEVVAADHTGPFPTPVFPRMDPYGFVLVDDASRLLQVSTVPSRQAKHILTQLKRFQTWARMRIQTLRTDRAREFTAEEVQQFLYDNNTVHQTTAGYAPQQNFAEACWRILLEMARTLLLRAKLSDAYFGYALHYAAWLWNRTIRSGADGRTPWEAAF